MSSDELDARAAALEAEVSRVARAHVDSLDEIEASAIANMALAQAFVGAVRNMLGADATSAHVLDAVRAMPWDECVASVFERG
jgi:hypothetical protein